MKFPTAGREDNDDLFAHTRMSFGDHIEELRLRMIRAILGFLAAMVIGLVVGQPVLEFIKKPVVDQLNQFYDLRMDNERKKLDAEEAAARQAADDAHEAYKEASPEYDVQIYDPDKGWQDHKMRLNLPKFTLDQQKYERLLNRPASLTTLTVTEAFMTYILVSVYCGVVLSSPWILWQLWMFIGAGLYPHEKKYVYTYLPLSVGLFLGGVALCEFVVLPLGVHYLLGFNEWLTVEPELRLSEWLNFAVIMPLIFGAAFQTPLLMLFLERMGIVNIELYTKNRRLAIFILALAAALLAVSPDPLSMMTLAVPLWGLYELGILLCRFAPKPAHDIEEPDPDEMVEV